MVVLDLPSIQDIYPIALSRANVIFIVCDYILLMIISPLTDWPENETEKAAQAAQSATEGEGKEGEKYLWEKSWDDDDTSDDFSAQLREELRKVDAAKRK